MNLNKVILCGRVTKAPEILMTQSGHKVAKISLATNEYQGKDKQDKTTFHNLVAWNKIADIAQQFVVMGHEIMIEGRIDNRSYEDKNGVKKYISEIIVERLQLGNKPRPKTADQADPNLTSNYQAPKEYQPIKENDDIPVIEDIDEIDISSIPF
ncbi:single-stranded DNA-binding protein [Methanoculleus sp.]|uniref:single-stranded DNA-binding protein n=1 Tax=Methanoculleus sp. TaxID=90427 RepID=UPI0025E76F88|nr:single-stranded DNA-binding protein [Methanoculleus sp.]MCK9318919.1 single-stranded DNA-binding protein [Methanoculleus sp.]